MSEVKRSDAQIKRRLEIQRKIVFGVPEAAPIVSALSKYVMSDKIYKFLHDNAFIGKNLVALFEKEYKCSELTMVKSIVAIIHHEKSLEAVRIRAGKEYLPNNR